jgi:hypothetical protein
VDTLWQTKRAPAWSLIAVAAAHIASAPFFNDLVFPHHWLSLPPSLP